MKHKIYLIIALNLMGCALRGQNDAGYIKSNGVPISDDYTMNDSVYQLLRPFQVILCGEMHGTNESAPFVAGLARMFLSKGDSVQVGLEIPPEQMERFLSEKTDSSVYQSEFFSRPAIDGRESVAWASLISSFCQNPKVQLFFFDINQAESKLDRRDSLMSAKILTQIQTHPGWRTLTLGGNFHNRISGDQTMAAYLLLHKHLKICSLNMRYSGGTTRANFGKGLEIRQMGAGATVPAIYPWDRFLLLLPADSGYPYHGYFYTRTISAAELTSKAHN